MRVRVEYGTGGAVKVRERDRTIWNGDIEDASTAEGYVKIAVESYYERKVLRVESTSARQWRSTGHASNTDPQSYVVTYEPEHWYTR